MPPDPDIIALALAEDIGTGDVTARWFTPLERTSDGHIIAKQHAILAGVNVAAEVFTRVDPSLYVEALRRDGDPLTDGDPVLAVTG